MSMTRQYNHLASAAQRNDYVLLVAGALRLLLPQAEVGEVEYLDADLCPGDQFGILTPSGSEGGQRYVALSENMELLPQSPAERFLVTPISVDDVTLRWCWDELRVLIAPTFRLEPLPQVLLASHTPFSHFMELDGKLAYLCSSRHLHETACARMKEAV